MSARRIDVTKRRRRLFELSGAALKWIGLFLTCLGTFGVAVLQRGLLKLDGYTNESLYQALQPGSELFGTVSAAVVCTTVSAMALPIFAKLLYEGWKHTSDVKKYLLRLAGCALVSEIPYDLAYRGSWFDPAAQNPLWGMLLAVIMLELMRRYAARPGILGVLLKAAFITAAAVWAVLIQSQLGIMFVLLAALYCCFDGNMVCIMLAGIALTLLQFPAPFGLLPVYWYSGKRGKAPARLFYWFYPAQLLFFALLGRLAAAG